MDRFKEEVSDIEGEVTGRRLKAPQLPVMSAKSIRLAVLGFASALIDTAGLGVASINPARASCGSAPTNWIGLALTNRDGNSASRRRDRGSLAPARFPMTSEA